MAHFACCRNSEQICSVREIKFTHYYGELDKQNQIFTTSIQNVVPTGSVLFFRLQRQKHDVIFRPPGLSDWILLHSSIKARAFFLKSLSSGKITGRRHENKSGLCETSQSLLCCPQSKHMKREGKKKKRSHSDCGSEESFAPNYRVVHSFHILFWKSNLKHNLGALKAKTEKKEKQIKKKLE